MTIYSVSTTELTFSDYYVEADSEEEAKAKVDSGEYITYEERESSNFKAKEAEVASEKELESLSFNPMYQAYLRSKE